MNESMFYVTTPIYYVNDAPHIGHAYTTILADVLARYRRLCGIPTFFLTGTDEHGQKVQRAAEKAGITPQEHADKTVIRFQELWNKLGITNDDFIRTTEQRHKTIVQEILQDLYDRDEIYKADYDGWYCVTCERFFADKDLQNENCPEPGCGRPVERIHEANYFFRMSKYQEWLITYIQDHPGFVQPDFRQNETLGFLQKPLNDLCISRPKTRLTWGIDLPFDRDFVTYVWFDALINYLSAVGFLSDDKRFKKWWPAAYHLIGKDILTTHTVYWPTMLKAMDLPLPKAIYAHGWWLAGENKMSKSDGNVVDPMAFADRYGVDAFRYFLMAEMTLGQDCSFSEEAFIRRYNADLANDLGNLLNRVMKLIISHCDGKIPAPVDAAAGNEERSLREASLGGSRAMKGNIETMRMNTGLAAIFEVVREANRFLEQRRPWTLAKEKHHRPLHTVLYHAAETLRIIGGLLYPVMPEKMMLLRQALGLSSAEPAMRELETWGLIKPGTVIGDMTSLFPRIKVPAGSRETTNPSPKTKKGGIMLMDYDDFAKIQLRTARILGVEPIEGADKLLRLQVQVGKEKRQLVAGIAMHYKPEELVGKSIVIVANLKPATIRGVESDGMLLAASSGDHLRLVTIDGEIPDGSDVK